MVGCVLVCLSFVKNPTSLRIQLGSSRNGLVESGKSEAETHGYHPKYRFNMLQSQECAFPTLGFHAASHWVGCNSPEILGDVETFSIYFGYVDELFSNFVELFYSGLYLGIFPSPWHPKKPLPSRPAPLPGASTSLPSTNGAPGNQRRWHRRRLSPSCGNRALETL